MPPLAWTLEKKGWQMYPKSVSYLFVMENGKTKQRCNHVIRSCDLFPETPNIELSDEKLAAHPTAKLRFLRMAGRAIWVQLMRWNSSTWRGIFLKGFCPQEKNVQESMHPKSLSLISYHYHPIVGWTSTSPCRFTCQSWWTCEGQYDGGGSHLIKPLYCFGIPVLPVEGS